MSAVSLNNLVSSRQQRLRDGEAERLGSFEVEHKLDFHHLLHRQIGRLLALVWGPRSQALIFTHSPLPSLPSYQFLCSTWNPVSSPRPTRVGGRRAQGLSRSAVAPTWRHAQSFAGRALTAPSTAARLLWSG